MTLFIPSTVVIYLALLVLHADEEQSYIVLHAHNHSNYPLKGPHHHGLVHSAIHLSLHPHPYIVHCALNPLEIAVLNKSWDPQT